MVGHRDDDLVDEVEEPRFVRGERQADRFLQRVERANWVFAIGVEWHDAAEPLIDVLFERLHPDVGQGRQVQIRIR